MRMVRFCRSANEVEIRATRDPCLAGTHAYRRRIAGLWCHAHFVPIDFDELGEVDVSAKSPFDRFNVHLQAVAGHLHSISEAARKVIDKLVRGGGIALADVPA